MSSLSARRSRFLQVEALESRDVPATFFVAVDGSDAAAGTADAPFQNIQRAVNVASAATNTDPTNTILVAKGTYVFVPSLQPLLPFNDSGERAVVTIFEKAMNLYGGFSRADRFQTANPQANPTVIDGEGQRRGVYVFGANRPAGIDLNGFTIRNGLATANPARTVDPINAYGGGMLLDQEAQPDANQPIDKIQNVTFENNVARGGNEVSAGREGGTGTGGALSLKFLKNVQLSNVVFRNNQAVGGAGTGRGGSGNGGALHSDTSNLTATDIVFDGNSATSANTTGSGNVNGGSDATGGAVSVQTRETPAGLPTRATFANFARATATNNRVTGGKGTTRGGIGFGGAFFAEVTPLAIVDSVISGNTATGGDVVTPTGPDAAAGGAGVIADRANLSLNRVRITNNIAKGGTTTNPGAGDAVAGGFAAGVYAFLDRVGRTQPVIDITNTVIAGNQSLAGPGAVANRSPGGGGAVRLTQVKANIIHSTIANNVLDPVYLFGTAIEVQNVGPRNAALPDTNVTILDSIVANNTGQVRSPNVGPPLAAISLFGSLTLTIRDSVLFQPAGFQNVVVENFSFFEGGQTTAPILTMTGNITSDPLFADAASRNYALTASSPAVNKGTGSTVTADISNGTRTGVPDIGAFELGTAGTAPNAGSPTGAASTTGAPGNTGTSNAAPTITAVGNVTVNAGGNSGAIAFTVADVETPAASLTVASGSSNTTLVPLSSIVLAGTGAGRTVVVTPAAGQTGTATISLTVTDGGGATASQSFTVTVPGGTNTPPTITVIGNVSVNAGASSSAIAFTVADAQTPVASLTVTRGSSNTTLLPLSGIALGGAGANRTVTITPAAGQSGTATVSLTVGDGGGATASQTFTVTVSGGTGTTPVLVGFPQFAVGGDVGSGNAALYNPDQGLRYNLTPFAGFTGGVRTAAADFNNDGVADLVVGTGPGRATQVQVLDGVTQKVLFSTDPFEAAFVGGIYVIAGDLTGDGRPELVVTPDEGGGPRVLIYDGATFNQTASFFGIDDPNFRGGARAAIGDINGDRVGDLVVGAGFQGGPRVAAFDGKSLNATSQRKLFGDFFAFEDTLRNGAFIAVGDTNGDGFAEIIAGGGPGGGPRVTVFNGTQLLANQFDVLSNFFGGDPASRGGIRVSVKNLDNDARADVVVGAGNGAGSRVTGYFGRNLLPGVAPAEAFNFDAIAGFGGGVYVG